MLGILFSGRAGQNDSTLSVAEARRVAENAGWGENVTLLFAKNTMTVQSNGLPNHEILALYQALSIVDNQTIYTVEPLAQSMSVVIPLQPKLAEVKTPTKIGLIGIAITGALIYSPFEADGKTYAMEGNFLRDGIPFLDTCNGHPNPLAIQYHYHGIPYCITEMLDREGEHSYLLGYLLDGFPVYGPQGEGGVWLSASDLDECNGHFGPTPEFPNGIYHYHFTQDRPYSSPCYAGEVGLLAAPATLPLRGTTLGLILLPVVLVGVVGVIWMIWRKRVQRPLKN